MPQISFQLLVFILLFSFKNPLCSQSNILIPFYDIAKCAYGFKTKEKAIVIDARFQKIQSEKRWQYLRKKYRARAATCVARTIP